MPVTKNLRDSSVQINDGTNTATLDGEEGDLSYTEQDAIIDVKDRGSLSHMREGDEEPVEGSFTLKFKEFKSDSGNSAYDLIKGNAVSGVGTNDDGSGVFTFEMTVTITDPAGGTETITFAKCHATEVEFSEADEYNTLAFTFTDYEVEPTYA